MKVLTLVARPHARRSSLALPFRGVGAGVGVSARVGAGVGAGAGARARAGAGVGVGARARAGVGVSSQATTVDECHGAVPSDPIKQYCSWHLRWTIAGSALALALSLIGACSPADRVDTTAGAGSDGGASFGGAHSTVVSGSGAAGAEGGGGATSSGGAGFAGGEGGAGADGRGGDGGEGGTAPFFCRDAKTKEECDRAVGQDSNHYCAWYRTWIIEDDACTLPQSDRRCLELGATGDTGSGLTCNSVKASCPAAEDVFWYRSLPDGKLQIAEWDNCLDNGMFFYAVGWARCSLSGVSQPPACACICAQ